MNASDILYDRPNRAARSSVLVILQTYVWMLMLLPSRLVIEPIGSFGSPAALVGVSAFGLWLTGFINPNLLERKCRPVRYSLLALWIPTLISYVLMHGSARPFDEVNSADRWLLFLLSWSGISLLASEGLRSRSDAYRLLRIVLGASATCALVGIVQSYLGLDIVVYIERLPVLTTAGEIQSILQRSGIRRPAGTAGHPIEFGVVLSLALGPALVMAFGDHVTPRGRRWFVLGAIALGIPLALSRSAVVGSIIAVSIWAYAASGRERRRGLIGGLCLLVLVFVTSPGVLGSLRSSVFGATSDSSISTRTDDYSAVAEYFRASPMFGHGPSTFLPKYRILDNQWAGVLIELGIVGVLGLAVFLAMFGWIGLAVGRPRSGAMSSKLGFSFVGIAAIMASESAFYDFFAFPMAPSLVMVFLGIAGMMSQSSDLAESAGIGAEREAYDIGDRE